jgi:hypothetical protein
VESEGGGSFAAQGQGEAGQGEDDDGRDEQVEQDGDRGQQDFDGGLGRPERPLAPAWVWLVPLKEWLVSG